MKRRLAAILATDVVGYSRLMGEDEAGTLAASRQTNGRRSGRKKPNPSLMIWTLGFTFNSRKYPARRPLPVPFSMP